MRCPNALTLDHPTLSLIFQLTEREDPSRKRGFGFVTFANSDDANAAVDNLDGLEVDGRSLRVNIAQPRPERPSW